MKFAPGFRTQFPDPDIPVFTAAKAGYAKNSGER
jgi:hypothetical protein